MNKRLTIRHNSKAIEYYEEPDDTITSKSKNRDLVMQKIWWKHFSCASSLYLFIDITNTLVIQLHFKFTIGWKLTIEV